MTLAPIKVLNICSFLPIDAPGFFPENDINLKTYSELNRRYNIQSEFVMPVAEVPSFLAILKSSLKIRYDTINKGKIWNNKYNLNIHFLKCKLPSILRLRGGFSYYYRKLELKNQHLNFFIQALLLQHFL